jgi:serine kinase of HPr protein (carbohydrate metabolism regulator)
MNYTATYTIAGQCVSIISIYENVHRLCDDYRSGGEPCVFISTTKADIDAEREKSAAEDAYEGIETRSFSDGYLETLAVYRKLAEALLPRGFVVFHASAVAVDGSCYLFTAKSGTGKSTHTALWRQMLGERAVMVNDDKPILQLVGDEIIVHGTPWDGKHRLSSPISVPLKGICILQRDTVNHIEQINIKSAYTMLLQQTYRPRTAQAMQSVLSFVDSMKNIPIYRLGCNISPEAAQTSYNAMTKKENA